MSVININSSNFEMIKNSDRPVLLDFYADWCGPCRMLAPSVEQIAVERDDVIVGKVNVDEESALAAEFGVKSIPTVIVIRDGEIASRAVGVRPKAQLLAMLNG